MLCSGRIEYPYDSRDPALPTMPSYFCGKVPLLKAVEYTLVFLACSTIAAAMLIFFYSDECALFLIVSPFIIMELLAARGVVTGCPFHFLPALIAMAVLLGPAVIVVLDGIGAYKRYYIYGHGREDVRRGVLVGVMSCMLIVSFTVLASFVVFLGRWQKGLMKIKRRTAVYIVAEAVERVHDGTLVSLNGIDGLTNPACEERGDRTGKIEIVTV